MKKTGRVLAIVLALTMLLSVSAFAAWNGFQGGEDNNGAIDFGLTSTPSVTSVSLPSTGALTGVSAESVISNGVAYTIYNGGTTGARLQATNVADGTQVWNIQLSGYPINVSQLSTPYTDGSNLYAAVTYFGSILPQGELLLDGKAVDPANITIPTGDSEITITGLDLPADYRSMQIDTGIYTLSTALSASATMSVNGATYDLGTSASWGGNFIMYNENVETIRVPAANDYTLTINFTNNTGSELTSSGIYLNVPSWELYKVAVSDGAKTLLTYGRGQANTSITADADNLYFGIYDGDHCYYQYPKTSTSVGDLVAYIPSDATEDFYTAGAAIVTIDGTDYAVFGSDNGKIYVRPTGSFESGSGNVITLARTNYPTGAVRSTVVVWNNNVYFTSKGGEYQGNSAGLVWKIPVSELLTAASVGNAYSAIIKYSESSTSTPAISGNGILYVGTNSNFSFGTIKAFDAATLTPYAGFVYEGEPVQSSPIVYSENNGEYADDYIFFTTNSSSGTGYCYYLSKEIGTGEVSVELVWTAGGSGYGLQGFAADEGHLVYGNDSNMLYIMD